MKNEQKNLILAIALSALILGGFELFFKPQITADQRAYMQQRQAQAVAVETKIETRNVFTRQVALAESKRVPVVNDRLRGSINLTGGQIDDLTLTTYRETVDPNSAPITLLSPANTKDGYYAEFGWVGGANLALPDAKTQWQATGRELTQSEPMVLRYDNGQGLAFENVYELSDHYGFTITQTVRNTTGKPITLTPYALIGRFHQHHQNDFFILHEGPLGVFNGVLEERRYNALVEEGAQSFDSIGGWIGITDKYWLAAIAPKGEAAIKARMAYSKPQQSDRYQVDYTYQPITIQPGDTYSVSNYFYGGAKEVKLLDRVESEWGIPRFDLAVDFGWFYFLTKPIFNLLHYLYTLLGNFGVAILMLTVIVKAIMFPLANKSYRTMNKMKDLQPQLLEMREKYGKDVLRLQKEMAAFYQKNKLNPLSGCLPIFIQIPVFFSLYKVLFVTIEMRHQPFFGWIVDLSAADPTNVLNLFGLMPWTLPGFLAFLHVGAWPIIMGFTMWLQMRLNPAPADPAQKIVFGLFPYIFTFLLASFPAGLVIYWSWSNLLGILQQYALKREGKKAAA
jgi:YidC/Oxa1 family membrane protein insertase